ncbi:MAG: hypothetical protein IKN63_03675 [Bacilli bacterium]|nr:hypothetical protein [Bacilli bacterium]
MEDKNDSLEKKKIDKNYEDKETKRRVPGFLLLCLITTVGVLFALGLSFSAISYLESNETINTLISSLKGDDNEDRYIITYIENTGNSETGIYLINQFPTPDEVGKKFEGKNYVFNFSLIIGRKTAGAYYELTAIENSDNTLNKEYVKVYLEKNGKGVDMSYKPNGKVKVYSEYENSKYNEAEGKVIYKDYINDEDALKGKIDFVMRMWVSEDVNVDSDKLEDYVNKKFSIKVNTYAAYLER